MSNELRDILVFKTNIQTEQDKQMILEALNGHSGVQDQHLDLKDVDCVLRIVSSSLTPEQIIAQVTDRGFECSELH